MALQPFKGPSAVSCLHSRGICPRIKSITACIRNPKVKELSSNLHQAQAHFHPRAWQLLNRQQCSARSYSTTLKQPSRESPLSSSNGASLRRRAAQSSLLSPIFKRSVIISATGREIKTYPPPPSTRARCKDPIAHITQSQLSLLDPSSVRTRLFSASNPEAAKVGDILLVRTRNGDPFAGVCINIRRRGVDTAILLRNQLTRVGVEMWFKIYSPNVEGIEVVQRRPKRARRARLYYMRLPKHDMGSVQGVVTQYLRQRALLRSGERGRGSSTDKKQGARGKKKV